ncbi:hypothetical protein ES705_39843 [subsurface metagenome]
MTELIYHRLTPEELTKEIEARAKGEGALVMLTVTQWKVIVEAYHSPLMKNIADTVLQVTPQRDMESKKLSFTAAAKEFKR